MRTHITNSSRRGLTIVEVLVSLVLVAVGILGIAGASALALRSADASALDHRARRIAELRIATLAARGCGGASSGADSAESLGLQWSLTTVANGGALVDESVTWTSAGKPRRLLVQAGILC